MTKNIFVASDHHLNHANILKFKDNDGNLIRRGFEDVDHMNEAIIDNHNRVVGQDDLVYFLGDFTFGSKANIAKYAPRFNGRKRLILGNHDYEPREYYPWFEKIMSYRQFGRDMFKRPVVLCHFPLHWDAFDGRTDGKGVNIHGHLHQNVTGLPYHINVCVEKIGYTPVSIETLLDRI